MASGYVLDQQGAEAAERERLELVERFHDPSTISVLERLGVANGWRCLDVGAGAGSITRWLAGRTLPAGEVVASDLDIRLLEPLSAIGVQVQRRDIMAGAPAAARFDLVHTRLLLIHLPGRERALSHLLGAARPGGWLVVGDIDFTSFEAVEPWPGWKGVWESFLLAVGHAGWDVRCGARLGTLLAGAGVQEVQAEASGGSIRGGDLGAEIMARTFERLLDRLIGMDVPQRDLETTLTQLRSPAQCFVAPTVWTAWGRKSELKEINP